MSQKINFKKTKEKMDKIVAQAKDSVKVLDALQKEGLARARSIIHQIPARDVAHKLTNEKIVSSLKKLGLATRSEVRELEKKVEELASELRTQISQVTKAARKAQKKNKDDGADANA
ncbi:MAG: hypothetical protein HY074_09535 [Deltaproteobacteria bacterium]|nr:hypothetical protein [Deltaproteobacteria bacterium]